MGWGFLNSPQKRGLQKDALMGNSVIGGLGGQAFPHFAIALAHLVMCLLTGSRVSM